MAENVNKFILMSGHLQNIVVFIMLVKLMQRQNNLNNKWYGLFTVTNQTNLL